MSNLPFGTTAAMLHRDLDPTNEPLCICGRYLDPYEAFEIDDQKMCRYCVEERGIHIETCGDCGTEFLDGQTCPFCCGKETGREAA